MNVVIVGGSLSGLLHAIVCKAHGHKVHVLEKSSQTTLQSQAAGISPGPEFQRFINEYVKPDKPYAKLANSLDVINIKGDIINTVPTPGLLQLTTWSILYRLLKSQLLENAESFGTGVLYETSQIVQDIQYNGDKVLVTYSNTVTGNLTSVEADLVIAADGGHSSIRTHLMPDISPKYAGYVTWRGTVPESVISEESHKLLEDRVIFFRTERGYTVSYHVPSESGSQAPGDRQFVWVWYEKMEENSEEFREVFTDIYGRRHLTTIPRGKMQPSVWAKKCGHATETLSKPFHELLNDTSEPFISAIRDNISSQAVFYDGKLILAGDAFSLFRPHNASSTNQAAKQALELAEVFKGTFGFSEWEKNAVDYAKKANAISIAFADYCFTGKISDILPMKPDNDNKTD